MTNYYKILGISEDASIVEIKAAITDKLLEDGPEAQPVMKAIYDLLTDPVKKAAYDKRLSQHLEKKYTVTVERNIPVCVYGPPPIHEETVVIKK